MKKWHFVYAPRAGARWIENAGPEATDGRSRTDLHVPYQRYGNGSAHVLGWKVSVEAATRGKWWRDGARKVAAELALSMGGVAFDDCGTVSVVVSEQKQARFCLRVLLHVQDVHLDRTDIFEPVRRAVEFDQGVVAAMEAGYEWENLFDVPINEYSMHCTRDEDLIEILVGRYHEVADFEEVASFDRPMIPEGWRVLSTWPMPPRGEEE